MVALQGGEDVSGVEMQEKTTLIPRYDLVLGTTRVLCFKMVTFLRIFRIFLRQKAI